MKTISLFFTAFTLLLLAMGGAVRAQMLLGGFQSAYDITDAGWVNPNTQVPITQDSADSFVAADVPGCTQSLKLKGTNGIFASIGAELMFSQNQIEAFHTNSWVTFIFSVPAWTNSGYSQIYFLGFNSAESGYHNLSWTNALEMGYTNDDTAGKHPNFYFYDGSPMRTQIVTVNYSSIRNIGSGGPYDYLQMFLEGAQGGGAPPYIYLNNVVLSTTPFGLISNYANTFVVDDFSSNGLSYANMNNYDYDQNNYIYSQGMISNEWGNVFGTAFSNLYWAGAVDAYSNSASGSLEIQLNWTPGSQFAVSHRMYYNANLSSLNFTNFQCDVKYAPGSACGMGPPDTYTNFGRLRFGFNDLPYWIASTNIAATNTGWTHISIPLSRTDPNLADIQSISIGEDNSEDGAFLNGPSTLYIDNTKFVGPENVLPLPGPITGIHAATPGLRIFGGDYASKYARQELTTADDNQSWISPIRYPVTYSFNLLSYPDSVYQTHIFLIPSKSIPTNTTYTAYGNQYVDYQAGNALWLDIQPAGNGAVTASVLWKTNSPNSNPKNQALSFTNSTALGTWTLAFNSPNSGSVTAPGNTPKPFTITDPYVSSDFANPLVAYFGMQPNSTNGEGEYEDWGAINVANVAGVAESEDFTRESNDFDYNNTTPSGQFQNDSSEYPAGLVIVRTNVDKYWVNWNFPAPNAALVTGTNLHSNPVNWLSPSYYSDYSEFPPRGQGVQIGGQYWALLPIDDLPTKDGGYQTNAPLINDPLSPTAYFLISTNAYNPFPYP